MEGSEAQQRPKGHQALNVAFQNLDILEEKSTVSYRFSFYPFFIQSHQVRHSKKDAGKLLTCHAPKEGILGLGRPNAEMKPRPGQPEGVKIPGRTRGTMVLHVGVDSWPTE